MYVNVIAYESNPNVMHKIPRSKIVLMEVMIDYAISIMILGRICVSFMMLEWMYYMESGTLLLVLKMNLVYRVLLLSSDIEIPSGKDDMICYPLA